MIFTVKDGEYRYPGTERTVLRNIGFSLQSGDVLTILGPNGAGKTTLLRCMLGLLPWTSGESALDGVPLVKIPANKLWSRISYVPQQRRAPVDYSVEEMVMLGRAGRIPVFSQPGEEDRRAVERALKKTGLLSLRKKSCAKISGGEYQMVLMARALASEPEILVLDEPESNLDFRNQLLVLRLIQDLSKEGMLCIFNTHYPAHALRWSTLSLLLSPAGDYLFGAGKELVTPENIASFFGVEAMVGTLEGDAGPPDVIPLRICREKE